jgi:hypothetical protein
MYICQILIINGLFMVIYLYPLKLCYFHERVSPLWTVLHICRGKKKIIISCSSLNCPSLVNRTPSGAILTQFTLSVHTRISLTFTLILHFFSGLKIVRFSQLFLYYPLQYISYLFTFFQMTTYFCVHHSCFHRPSWHVK